MTFAVNWQLSMPISTCVTWTAHLEDLSLWSMERRSGRKDTAWMMEGANPPRMGGRGGFPGSELQMFLWKFLHLTTAAWDLWKTHISKTSSGKKSHWMFSGFPLIQCLILNTDKSEPTWWWKHLSRGENCLILCSLNGLFPCQLCRFLLQNNLFKSAGLSCKITRKLTWVVQGPDRTSEF